MQPGIFLKNAEMAVEDDYNMIDGIINNGPKGPTVAELEAQVKAGQTISLMDLAGAVHRERQPEKKSVVKKLKNKPKQGRKQSDEKTNKARRATER